MSPYLNVAGLIASGACSLIFSTLTYSLRNITRVRLGELLEARGKGHLLEPTMSYLGDLIFVTAIGRLVANILMVLAAMRVSALLHPNVPVQYLLTAIISALVMMFCSVAIPHALSEHASDRIVASWVNFLHLMRKVMAPFTTLMHVVDDLVGRAIGPSLVDEPQAIEQEILSAVQEGEKEGVVDVVEREMIESVIRFRATTAGQIMTPRPEVIALELQSTLDHVKQTLEESGHSRVPVYDGTLDHVVGILYARDLLKYLGSDTRKFEIRTAMRPPFFVPEVKPLRDLLMDFRLQKVHIAIVLDEYGGTAGLVTIEDILEELVGEISDEHEPVEQAMFRRLDDHSAEVDGSIYIDELNRLMGLDLPEDAGYDTLGGFISTTLGKIPPADTVFEHGGAKFTILSAEPQKVNRVKIELLPQPVEAPQASSGV